MSDLQIIDQRKVLGKDFRIYGDLDTPIFLAKDVAEWIEHSNPTEMVRTVDESEKLNSTILSAGQMREVTFLTEDGLYEVLMQSRKPIAKEFKKKVKEILKTIRKTGSYSVHPPTQAQALLQAVQLIAEQEQKILQIETQQTVIQHRLDVIDAVDTIGDLQQRLNAMVRKFAHQRGVLFSVAWGEFVEGYNTAYRTNLKLLIGNYEARHEKRKMTTPQYLADTGKLEDAIRVADKMLNRGCNG